MSADVVITGYSSISALGNLNNEFLEHYKSAKYNEEYLESSEMLKIRPVRDFIFKNYKTRYSYNKLDASNKYALAACNEALEMAQLADCMPLYHNGLLLATSYCGASLIWRNIDTINRRGKRYVSPFKWSAGMQSTLSVLCREFSIQGYNCCINEDIVSSLAAVRIAYDYIKSGQKDIMVIVGVDPLDDIMLQLYQSAGVLVKRKTGQKKIFEEGLDSIILGEACAVLVLESQEHALRRNAKSYGKISGVSVKVERNMSKNHGVVYDTCMDLLNGCNVDLKQVDHICSGANGNTLIDFEEQCGYKKMFETCQNECKIATIKSYTGETVGAGGLLSMIASIIAFQYDFLPCIHSRQNMGALQSDISMVRDKFKRGICCGVGELGQCYAVMMEK